jgi:hypothetical protein
MAQMATQARESIQRIDLRRLRAEALFHGILQHVRPYLRDDADLRKIHEGMLRELYDTGAEVVSDYDRDQLGLPPRGPDGWTDYEIAALEQLRLDAMTKPLHYTIPIGGAIGIKP